MACITKAKCRDYFTTKTTEKMLIQFKIFRRLFGGSYQKVWFQRQIQGGYTAWKKARPGFDWETINGRIVDQENYDA